MEIVCSRESQVKLRKRNGSCQLSAADSYTNENSSKHGEEMGFLPPEPLLPITVYQAISEYLEFF